MTRRVVLLFGCSLLLANSVAAQKVLSASKAWVKAPVAGDTTAVAFAVVDNPTMYDVYLVSATTDAAGSVQFVKSPKAGAKPEAVDALSAPAYGALELKSDGIYMLLNDLKRALKPGDSVAITIMTDGGAAIEATAEVRPN